MQSNDDTRASILIADDRPANLLALEAVLHPLGARIVRASSGREVLEHVVRESFAVVLLDVQMPELDGLDTAARIRESENGREVPIIFLTAIHCDERFVRKGYEVGAADYITKPFDPDVVRARVRAFVSLYEQREEVRRAQVAVRTQERDEAVRRLVAFEHIAASALQSDDLQAFLRELLGVFMSAAADADSVAILLSDPPNGALRVHASVGSRDSDCSMSFAASVVTAGQPLEVCHGTTGHYGVPLRHEGEILGVAHIGSRRASRFSRADKHLFVAMADRAAAAVAQYLRIEHRARLLDLEHAARLEAETANRMKDDFLATVSHELRTPLNAILGWAVLARSKAPRELDHALEIIERNARAQARMIEDVLDVSRVVSGKLRLDPTQVALRDIIESALDAVRPAAEANGIDLAISIPAGIELRADAQRLQQVVWNLLSNAIKFSGKGGCVELSAIAVGDSVVLRVTDGGVGIDASFLPHVFEPFRQADASTTRQHGGLGLGLAIVKHIVDAHGGTIRATSAGLGQGSTFIVELPRGPLVFMGSAQPHERGVAASRGPYPPGVHPRRSSDPGDTPRLEGMKILVVDDDSDARRLLAHLLSDCGADVVEASSAATAFQEVTRFRPDVLVSDIAMPGSDGYRLIRAVRALPGDRGGDTPAIAVSAYARSTDGERAHAAGFQAHLAKPVDPSRLVSVLKHLSVH